jgi:histidine triad (HIT) family protein
MATVTRMTRAVGQAFPSEGISLWHSIGPAAFQEIPHLHIHIHPRKPDDNFLRIYPSVPAKPDWTVLSQYAQKVKAHL